MEFPTIDEFAKEVAEKVLDEIIYGGKTIREWIEIIIKQQPCEDCISRQEAIKEFQIFREYSSNRSNSDWVDRIEAVLKDLPSVTPQPKTGHWIRWYEQKETERYTECIPHCKCSECGKEYYPHSSQFIKFCSNCGARMVEPQESEDKE